MGREASTFGGLCLTIMATIPVDLPRLRIRALPGYGQLYSDILGMLDEAR